MSDYLNADLDRTVHVNNTGVIHNSDSSAITIIDGDKQPYKVVLDSFGKDYVSFGRAESNDIVLVSHLVSGEHGRFRLANGQWMIEDKAVYSDRPSTNGVIINDATILRRALGEGDIIRIDDGVESVAEGVLMLFSTADTAESWNTFEIGDRREITIGRDPSCTIVLPHISISKVHASIKRDQSGSVIEDNDSTNGVIVNNKTIGGSIALHEKDVISISNAKLIYTGRAIMYCLCRTGISVDASHVVITRGKGKKKNVTGNDISMSIRPGELVAIVGGSGAGKSTILNSLCGYLPPESGSVYISGVNLYQNFDSLKKIIGYVPQSDIVYDNLTLRDMLTYTARLRLPDDITETEREEAIDHAIELVELSEKKDSYIKSLSGGQRKRASIAVELLSDPNLIFLDEPASGLDPGTERNLMLSLRKMADNGKTIILVTHSTLQLSMCDKIAFMGKGGNLCFFGNLDDSLTFFGVSDVVDIYNMITEEAPKWREKYDRTLTQVGENRSNGKATVVKENKKQQLKVLCNRYAKLVINDRQRLVLLLIQAPVLALLIALVADGEQFAQYEITKSLLFALSCSAFWVGMLNAIQEICKERSILKREYMTGLSLNSYILSKLIVLGVLCLIQSICIICVFTVTVGLPDEGLFMPPFIELLITTFLTAVSSTAMGLFVSSLFTNSDRAMTVAPILLMPQILFSGLIFTLEGATKLISWLAICRWSMEGYGTTANLNNLELKLQQEGVMIPHEIEDFYEFAVSHLMKDWFILILFVGIFLVLTRLVLTGIAKENA